MRFLPLLLLTALAVRADERALFDEQIKPVLREYCLNCHSTEKQKGDLDLEVFGSLEEVKKKPKIWQTVAEQLADHEMPPKAKPQPSAEQWAALTGWTGRTLLEMARAHAGDPGPVVLRRLSNAEYTYTLRDLTGLDGLAPAKEFPVDGAAGEGFTNTGQALVMSPALLSKYLEAGKAVAKHAVLLPEGFRFTAGDNRRDWTQECLQKVRAFYQRFTTSEGGQQVDLQGVKFETNGGGRLPVEKYLAAILKARAALLAGQVTPEAVAAQENLNARYLGLLWQELSAGAPSLLLDNLRERCQTAAPAEAPALAAEITRWEKVLWKFNNVGSLGVPGKPVKWMEPASKLQSAQELRVKLPAAKPGETVTVYLNATAVGETQAAGIIWDNPRVVAKGRPDALLRDLQPALAQQQAPPASEAVPAASVYAAAGTPLEVRIPAEAAAEGEFVVIGHLAGWSQEASLQLSAGVEPPKAPARLAGRIPPNPELPVVVAEGSATRHAYEAAYAAFRDLFPAALCYEKIVPTDEVITLVLFHREDDQLCRLMLDDGQKAQLDRLWTELRFITQDALTTVDVLSQIVEFASQDSDPKPFKAMHDSVAQRAAEFRQKLAEAEPRQLQAVIDFASEAYRRPATEAEQAQLRALYAKLRAEELPHDEALHLTLAKIFVTPPFLYRGESPGPEEKQAPVTAWELASRLSYFLTSSQPDAELRAAAASGQLLEPAVLSAQARRLLADPRVSRLATEFACQWLHIRDFDTLDEKSEKAFPTFAALRGDLYEESLRFFTDLFQNGGSILGVLDADHTFLNEALAKHYGIPGVTGEGWRRVDGVRRFARGGLLTQGTALAKMSGASRTSPVLRGNWVTETLLGERIPRPPKDVPALPTEETADTLTVKQLTEKHTSDARCAGCHARMDPFGFALENFDAIGRFREQDSGGRPIEPKGRLLDGTELQGPDGLRDYLVNQRRDAFVHQFCRKLLGFALGRGVQLSDEPLLTEMGARLAQNGYRFDVAVEAIVQSRQFRDIRGAKAVFDE